jgi:hypothetical protein
MKRRRFAGGWGKPALTKQPAPTTIVLVVAMVWVLCAPGVAHAAGAVAELSAIMYEQ